jgi:D-proline reductase (dithiol) PrdB
VILQRAIEKIGIPTILIAALPPVAKQNGAPRVVAPRVPMGANVGEPNNVDMQMGILKDTLKALVEITTPATIVPLDYEYIAKV